LVAFATGTHARPQVPQCALLVVRLVSQPFIALPSQLPKPRLHTCPQLPLEHMGEAFADAEHATPHEPQCIRLTLVLTQVPPQFVCPAAQPLTQRIAVASHIGVAPEHA
jgi:hypothetical protein